MRRYCSEVDGPKNGINEVQYAVAFKQHQQQQPSAPSRDAHRLLVQLARLEALRGDQCSCGLDGLDHRL
ncbi:unnamed protein product [Vitrella brassicaformis CCMP3155]|uniref:Uncharacterized protein n=1 Tax=Vitrella brassicaformis (strain CCMP3155) TaxID=1169540 RepID=A0A0G4EXE0_VITBC|nr:unnamed protein product [Vitrella brassicaformis CCMP3155]|eukprot:CEM02760.1 unnamed protein product [Vitrella brassicaformis CCMP3155]